MKKYIRWFIIVVCLLLLMVFIIAWLLFQTDLGYTITISPETTYVTEPLLPDGRVDYITAWNERSGQGVTPKNNAVIPFIRVVGLEDHLTEDVQWYETFCQRLGVTPADLEPLEDCPVFVSFYDRMLEHVALHEESKSVNEHGFHLGNDLPEPMSIEGFWPADAPRWEILGPETKHERYDDYLFRPVKDETLSSILDEQERKTKLLELQIHRAINEPWSPIDYPAVAWWLDENARALDELSLAFNRSNWYVPIARPAGTEIFNCEFPLLQKVRFVSEALTARAMLRLDRKDLEGAWQDIITNLSLVRAFGRSAYLLRMKTGYDLEIESFFSTVALLSHYRMTTEERLNYLRAIQSLPVDSPAEHLDFCGRILYIELLAAIPRYGVAVSYNRLLDKGPSSPQQRAVRNLLRRRVDWDRLLQRCNTMIDELVLLFELPCRPDRIRQVRVTCKPYFPEIEWPSWAEWQSMFFKADLADYVFRDNMQKLQSTMISMMALKHKTVAWRRIIEIVVRLALYRQAHREFPDTLDALLDDPLGLEPADPELLVDPFSETGNFIYQKNPDGEKGYFLYSVGQDGYDDNGRCEDTFKDHFISFPNYQDDIAVRVGPEGYIPPSVWDVGEEEEIEIEESETSIDPALDRRFVGANNNIAN